MAELEARTGLACGVRAFPLAVLTDPACPHLALDGGSVVIGSLFARHGPARRLDRLDDAEDATACGGGGAGLLRGFWGGYVAALRSGDTVRVLRDPSAALPCYMAFTGPAVLLASDVDLLIMAGDLRPALDWTALGRHLFGAGLPSPETILTGIRELLPGFAVAFPGDADRQLMAWSPWDHVDNGTVNALEELAERLRRVVRQTVRAWTGDRRRPLVSLSGGLDSSIVAACLAEAGAAVCLTTYADDPLADERDYARQLCRHLGLELVEARLRLEDVDIEAPLAAHLPRPFGFTHALAYERAHGELARKVAADAFVTGNGGDQVFAYSQSAAAIADRMLAEGLGRGVLHTLGDVCRQTGCSVSQAATAALRLAWSRPGYRWRYKPAFLAPDLLARIPASAFGHPWLEAPPTCLPGKAAHVATLLRVQRNLEPPRSRLAPVLNPLLSQPVMETCLAIPSWMWRAGGVDRAVARQAFARDLPEVVVRRRTKGSPDSFAAQLLDHYRGRIRERLLDGRLIGQAMLDRAALEEALRGGVAQGGEARMRILELLAVEAWLDSWTSRLSPSAASRRRP
ncbi:asparagine synthase C-terminal domain-containing protein [Sphingosinicella sp. CPCC 101087]|uniref:asparagine synthase-related protein n=1 Tax=Sphingosinicella sp. CPCC 101087 TaxID=2497754 RepID=UPI00101D0CA5|nr:asparagine synthase C-terminal domain-containing protein [Sphingosinicella sp. CPCC 101087]